ncbi:hypothetical protein [Mesorhizobium sp.]|uniref:hypothetical protein n=1 Tax=Mesorhizobium sp. TaxID=1871066 RepID=UPI000FE78F5E|nr:hypothetical protein [Mesorhizobium sp.]RWN11759.1 MAG: hypothetical protein EOR87_14665 [Mesorhizobium sp.]RWN19454.1 MAG: hypothetical protein EOR88_09900 [Mesorhizobium sp.]
MPDPREQILARLLAVAKGIDSAFDAKRNETRLPDTQNYVVLLDGEEVADTSDPAVRRSANAARRVEMTPEVQFRAQAKAEDIGAKLNQCRAKLIDAVMSDAQLLALTHNGQSIRYEGARMVAERGRSMEGGIGIAFTFTYVLRPGQVAG